tara:strand:+ start:81987 stop:82688 length:702 start_codon:yes stop_codon:yes gene_type:complete
MDQDFAKRRIRTPLADPGPPPKSSGLVLLLTGVATGIVIGMFISLLAYLGGMLPPAPGHVLADQNTSRDTPFTAAATNPDNSTGALTDELEREASRLQLEFYQELPNYEVVVDVTPVSVPQPRQSQPESAAESITAAANTTAAPVTTATPEVIGSGSFMLQAGAFQQQATASAQLNRLLSLGLSARIRQESLPGRTLFLVQAGPYASREEMLQAERVLRSNSIDTMRITLNQP